MFLWKDRLRAAGIHLALSLLVATLAAVLVFGLWYPYPYREISGGRELFLIVVAVDIVLGPLITFAIFNRAKPMTELRRDLVIVVALQLAGLSYGLWTVAVARPVHLVFEIDRFRVVHAIDVPDELLEGRRSHLSSMPWTGPTLLSVRSFHNSQESFDATVGALQGLQLGFRPDLWQSYEAARADVLKAAKPVEELKKRLPAKAQEIDMTLAQAARSPAATAYVPLAGRNSFWTAFVDPSTAQVVGFMPLDSF